MRTLSNKRSRAEQLYLEGESGPQIAAKLGISAERVYQYLREKYDLKRFASGRAMAVREERYERLVTLLKTKDRAAVARAMGYSTRSLQAVISRARSHGCKIPKATGGRKIQPRTLKILDLYKSGKSVEEIHAIVGGRLKSVRHAIYVHFGTTRRPGCKPYASRKLWTST